MVDSYLLTEEHAMSWMTQTDAATTLGCSIRTIRRRIRRNTLNSRRDGRNILVQVNPDDAVPGVHALSRRPATTLATATAELGDQTADELVTLSSTLRDTMSALSDYHQTVHVQARDARRSVRTAWLVTGTATLTLALGGWLYHTRTVTHTAALNDLQQALVATQARYTGEYDVQQMTLQRERIETQNIREENTALVRQLAEVSAQRERASADRDRFRADRDDLSADLGKARGVANLADMVKGLTSMAVLALRELAPADELRRLRSEAQAGHEIHRRELADAELRVAELARARARREGEVQALTDALEHERQTVDQAQSRLEAMAHKLIAVATDRARLELERDQLAAEVKALRIELRAAQGAADLRAMMKDMWSRLQLALRQTGLDRSALTTEVPTHSQVCDSDTILAH